MSGWGRVFGGVLVAAVLGSGCGTLVPKADQVQSSAPQGQSGSPAVGGADNPAAQASSDQLSSAAASSQTGSGTGSSRAYASSTGAGASLAAGGASQSTKSGVPSGSSRAGAGSGAPTAAGPIQVGLMYSSDANSTIGATGAAVKEPDYQAVQNAVIAAINRTGGVGGHRLAPVYYNVSLTDSSQQMSQGACTQWTQDSHVMAAIPSQTAEDNALLSQCLGVAHVLSVYEAGYSTLQASKLEQLPFWFEPDNLSLEELATIYAKGLAQEGFFSGARVGVVYDSYPQFSAVTNGVLLPAIRAAGGDVVSTFQQGIHSASDLSSGSAQMSGAVLQFRSKNVNKVMFLDAWAPAWLEFAIAAQNQDWHPIYGLSSQDLPQDAISTGLLPSAQLPGDVFVGWDSVFDVPPQYAGVWSRQQECLSIFREAGIDISSGGTDGYALSMSVCGGLLDLQDAGRLVSGAMTSAALARAMAELGNHLQSPDVQVTRFGADRQYGVGAWRPGAYAASCNCFQYTGRPNNF